jgi:hypothetical protein
MSQLVFFVKSDLNKKQKEATKHSNELGAGAKKRKKLKPKDKVGVVMHEFKRGTLHSGSGEIVKDRKQAIAIAMSEAGKSNKKKKMIKSQQAAIGSISGSGKYKKVAEGKWVPINQGQSGTGTGKQVQGLQFKDGFYFDGKVKITNNYEKAKQYAEKKSGKSSSAPSSVTVGSTVRIKADAKSSSGVREHKARGMVAKVKEIKNGIVKLVNDAGETFTVKQQALSFAKSVMFGFNLLKSGSHKYIKKIPKSGGGYKYIYKEDQKNTVLKYDDLPIKDKIKFKINDGKEILLDKIYHSRSSNSVYKTYKLGNNEVIIRFSDHKKQSSYHFPSDFSFKLSEMGTEETKEKIKNIFEEKIKKEKEKSKAKFPLYKRIKEKYGLKINQKTQLGIIKDFIHYEGEGDFAEMENELLYNVEDIIRANQRKNLKKSTKFGFFNLLKAGSHKYIKRTGSKGNYKYWYENVNGKLRERKIREGSPEDKNTGIEIKNITANQLEQLKTDVTLRKNFIMENQKYINSIIGKNKGLLKDFETGQLDIDTLKQNGNIGFIRAINNFDMKKYPPKTFSTYLYNYVLGFMKQGEAKEGIQGVDRDNKIKKRAEKVLDNQLSEESNETVKDTISKEYTGEYQGEQKKEEVGNFLNRIKDELKKDVKTKRDKERLKKELKIVDLITKKDTQKEIQKVVGLSKQQISNILSKIKNIGMKYVDDYSIKSESEINIYMVRIDRLSKGLSISDDLSLMKNQKVVFGFLKSDETLQRIKKLLIHILEKNEKKKKTLKSLESLELGFFDILKSKGFPVGTKREWKGKKYIKVSKNKWRRFYEGESRGQKLSLAFIKKKIMQATSVKELAQIVSESRKRFVNEDDSVHPVVDKLLNMAKEQKKGRGKDKQKRKEREIKDISQKTTKELEDRILELNEALSNPDLSEEEKTTLKESVNLLSKETFRRSDEEKQKQKETKKDQYTPTKKEKDIIETERTDQIEKAMDIDSKIQSGEKIDELRNGENYYNEKPSEILNTGKEVWGAARHKYDTYEISELNLEQMEKDGTAKKMITKKNLVVEPTLNNFDERVKNGEDGSKILLENVIFKLLKNEPVENVNKQEEYNKQNRKYYNDFCRILNRCMAETNTGAELFVALSTATENYKKAGDPYSHFEKKEGQIDGIWQAEDILGMELLSFLHMEDYKYQFRKLRKDIQEMIGKTAILMTGKNEITENEAKRVLFGEKVVLEEKGLGSIKKGDKVTIKKEILEGLYRVKHSFDNDEKENQHNKESIELRKVVDRQFEEEAEKFLENFKGTEKYNRIKKIEEDEAKDSIKYLKEKYIKKDGSLSIAGTKRYIDMKGFNSSMNSYKEDAKRQLRNWAIRQIKPDEIDYEKKRKRELIKERQSEIDNKYLTTKQIKIVSNEVVVGTATKNSFRAVLEFEDGRRMEKTFPYDSVDSVNKAETSRKKGRKIDYYIETKADRKGGTDKYESMSPVGIQKELHDKFKLKSTTFGNSVPDKEREFHLRKTAEAFSDLSEVLKLDSNIVSANGKLGVAWGAFGGLSEKGALATYHPDQKLLTLTRKKGFGSFAHEWGHFMDHILGGGKYNYSSDGGGFLKRVMEKPDIIPDGSILTIKKKNRRTGEVKGEERYYYESKGNSRYPYIKLQKGQIRPSPNSRENKRYSFYEGSLARMLKSQPDLNSLEIPKTDKEVRVSNNAKETASYISAIMQEDLKESEITFNQKQTDKDIQEWYRRTIFQSSYLNDTKECFARAFEVYISDKLDKMGRENTYLASQKKTKKGDGSYIYPQKEERRKEIYNLFEKFFDQIRGSEELRKSINRLFGPPPPKLVFKVKTKNVKVGFLKSKISNELKKVGLSKNRPDKDFNTLELYLGAIIEMGEHTGTDFEGGKEIAKDHLLEDKNYYKKDLFEKERKEAMKKLSKKLYKGK